MDLDRLFGYPEFAGGLLVEIPGDDQGEDLPLPGGEGGEAPSRGVRSGPLRPLIPGSLPDSFAGRGRRGWIRRQEEQRHTVQSRTPLISRRPRPP